MDAWIKRKSKTISGEGSRTYVGQAGTRKPSRESKARKGWTQREKKFKHFNFSYGKLSNLPCDMDKLLKLEHTFFHNFESSSLKASNLPFLFSRCIVIYSNFWCRICVWVINRWNHRITNNLWNNFPICHAFAQHLIVVGDKVHNCVAVICSAYWFNIELDTFFVDNGRHCRCQR